MITKEDIKICIRNEKFFLMKDLQPVVNSHGFICKNNPSVLDRHIIVSEVDKSILWINKFVNVNKLRKTLNENENIYSYYLKHCVEKWLQSIYKKIPFYNNSYYISNGAFIAAAILCGLTAYQIDNTEFAYINIHNSDLSYFDNFIYEAFKEDK